MPIRLEIEGIFPPAGFFLKKGASLESSLRNALQSDVTATLVGALAERSANWSTSPLWSAKISGSASLVLDLKPTGAGEWKWRWVSGGTQRHDITPKKAKYLKFGSGYVPKTLPGGTFAKSGNGEYIGGDVFTQHVDHPGIDARNFEQDVVDEKGAKVKGILAAAVAAAMG